MRLLPSFRGMPGPFWLLWVGTFINRAGAFVVPFLALYLTRGRGFSPAAAGTVVSLLGVGSFAAGPLGGACADRFGRKPTLAIGLTLGAAAMLGLGLARGPVAIGAAAFSLGLFGDAYRPASSAMIADLLPPGDRSRGYSLIYWAVNLGFSIAPVLAGFMLARGFFTLFALDAATTLAFAALVALRLPETHPSRGPAARDRALALANADGGGPDPATAAPPTARAVSPYADGAFVAFLLLTFATALLFHQGFVALPIDLRARGISEAGYGRLIAVNGLLIVAVQPLVVPHLGGRTRAALAFGALFTGLGFGANAIVSGPAGFAGAIVVWTLGEILLAPVTSTYVAAISPTHARGAYQGAVHMAWAAATCLAPIGGPIVLERFGSRALWGACAAVGALAAIGHAVRPMRAVPSAAAGVL